MNFRVDFNRNHFFISLFLLCFVLQTTGLKFIWGLESISSVANTFVLLAFFILFFLSMLFEKYSIYTWLLYILPGFLVFTGMLLNIGHEIVTNNQSVSYIGLLINWVAYLSAPMLFSYDRYYDVRIWSIYHRVIYVSSVLFLLDYSYVYLLGHQGFLSLVKTSGGEFLSSYISLYYPLENGSAHYRMYGFFLEPGTLAMFLIPAICYGYMKSKYISVAFMIVCMLASASLGGFISLILLAFFILIYDKKNNIKIASVLTIIVLFLGLSKVNVLVEIYNNKSGSKDTREENIINGITELPDLIVNNPFGSPLRDESSLESAIASFTNFMPLHKMVVGGTLAFLAYCMVIVVCCAIAILSIKRKTNTFEDRVVFASTIPMLLFVVQRTTILESSMFCFLYSASYLRVLSASSKHR